MKRQLTLVAMITIVLAVLAGGPLPAGDPPTDAGEWWNIPYPEPFPAATTRFKLEFIHVEGNRFVNDSGEEVRLAGVNISDPDKLVKNGRWSREHFKVIADWGADVVRIPIHPIAWRERGKDGYFALLDQAVRWADELGLYLIIEWHGIGNLKSEVFQHPMHETTKGETFAFWRAIAHRYAGVPTVAFYELFNEPTVYGGQLGRMSWAEWKELNEEMIHIIFALDRNVIPLVGGFNWAYSLNEIRNDPIDAFNIGYVTHPYPMKATEPLELNWERDFGFLAETYPVFATELGFMAADDPGAHNPVIADESYGRRIVRYLDRKGMSWAVWNFDPDWPPQMISDWDYTPTAQGEFFRSVFQERQ